MANKYDHSIIHCKGKNCEKKDTCCRYIAYKEALDTKKSGTALFLLNNQESCINNYFCYHYKLKDGK